MLYRIEGDNGVFEKIEPVEFKDFSSFGKLEKDLENLIAQNILDVLFEDAKLMPIFQERQWQSEADIYALNETGELVIFELKRASAGDGAVQQALRYAQDSGQWTYQKIERKYQEYSNSKLSLVDAHREAFSLEHKLEPKEINKKQHLIIIGSALKLLPLNPEAMDRYSSIERQHSLALVRPVTYFLPHRRTIKSLATYHPVSFPSLF